MTDDINIHIAEAMGFVQHAGNARWVSPYDGELLTLTQLPRYTTDHNAAFTLCDRLKSDGWRWRASTEDTHSETCFQFVNDEFAFEATAPTLPMAICLAFLKVMESQIPLLTNPPSTD